MVFVYPYIRHQNDWDILRSIEWLMDAFPQATVFTIGDTLPNRENIPHKKRYHERGCDVTDKILTFAREIGGDAIYMNDDFFIDPNFDPYTNLRNGMLRINPDHFLKSLYLNVHTFMSIDAENLKIGRPDILKANQLLDKYGCFSISDDFKQHNGPDFLNRY